MISVSWEVLLAVAALLAFIGPVLVYIGRWMHRTDALEQQVRLIWARMDERDARYTKREERLDRRLASVERRQEQAACPLLKAKQGDAHGE